MPVRDQARQAARLLALVTGLSAPMALLLSLRLWAGAAFRVPGESAVFLMHAAGTAVPWLVGAWLLGRRPRLGTAVMVAAAVYNLPDMVSWIAQAITVPGIWPSGLGTLTEVGLWVVMVAAGVAAWVGRPEGGWRGDGEVPRWFVGLVALAVVVPVGWSYAVGVVVGARSGLPYLTVFGGQLQTLHALTRLAVIVLGTLALVQLRRAVAGAAILAVVAPLALSLLAFAGLAVVDGYLAGLSSVVVSAVAVAPLLAVAAVWVTEGEPVPLDVSA